MNTATLSSRFTALTAVAAIFAAAALASMPVQADTIPAAKTRAEVKAELQSAQAAGELEPGHRWGVDVPAAVRAKKIDAVTPAKADKAVEKTSSLTRDEVRAELFRARAAGEVQPGGYAGPFFERSTVRRSVGE
jgi:hypothetical protein